MIKRKKFLVLFLALLIIVCVSSVGASSRISCYQGSVLMWAKTTVEWVYSNNTITNSICEQAAGYIFPNIARATGITLFKYDSSHYRYSSNFTIGAGIVTPWGDVTIYSQSVSHRPHIYGSGSYYWE